VAKVREVAIHVAVEVLPFTVIVSVTDSTSASEAASSGSMALDLVTVEARPEGVVTVDEVRTGASMPQSGSGPRRRETRVPSG
jgi:hypothetical protein